MKQANGRKCYVCGGTMHLSTSMAKYKFQGKELEIKGIQTYICEKCGEEIYTDTEAKMIERILAVFNQPGVTKSDILDLSETAKYLRVSNQTVYNMIRDGRIKAYKVGREWRFLHSDILAYMESSSNHDFLTMAAKGGEISKNDMNILKTVLEEEN